jgi:hypothetical protein
MDGLKLLAKARAAGLTVEAQGDRLVIKGPKRANAVANELIENKTKVMAALAKTSAIPSKVHSAITGRTENGVQSQQRHAPDAAQLGSRPVAKASRTEQFKRFTEADPGKVTVHGQAYHVGVTSGMWFFRMDGHPEAGWTCCSRAFVTLIQEQLESELSGPRRGASQTPISQACSRKPHSRKKSNA